MAGFVSGHHVILRSERQSICIVNHASPSEKEFLTVESAVEYNDPLFLTRAEVAEAAAGLYIAHQVMEKVR